MFKNIKTEDRLHACPLLNRYLFVFGENYRKLRAAAGVIFHEDLRIVQLDDMPHNR